MLRALHVEGCGFANNAGHDEREPGSQLLHRAADDRMRLGLMPALQDGTERPTGTAHLYQQESTQQRAAETFVHGFRTH